MKQLAGRYKELGLNPMPCMSTKNPAGLPHPPYKQVWNEEEGKMKNTTWKQLQSEMILDEAIEAINWEKIGVITGEISGNLEVIDVDTKNAENPEKLWEDLVCEIIEYFAKELYERLYITQTVSGGFHIYYRCDAVQGNLKLAKRDNNEVLIETRGEGGYVVAYPSEGYGIVQGLPSDIPVISAEERQVLLNICRGFNEVDDTPAYTPTYRAPEVPTESDDDNPFKAFNDRGDAVGLLLKHGWSIVRETRSRIYLKRPGNSSALHSGDWHKEKKLFKVFSTSTQFEDSRAYDAAGIYSMLECNNDNKETVKRLVSEGYGKHRESQAMVSKSEAVAAVVGEERSLAFNFDDFADDKGKVRVPHQVAIQMIADHYVFMRGYGYFFPKNNGVIEFEKPIHQANFIAAVRDLGYSNPNDVRAAIESSDVKKISTMDIMHHQLTNTPWDGVDRINDTVKAMNLRGDNAYNVKMISLMLHNILAFALRGADKNIDEAKVYQRVAMILLSQQKGWGKTTFWRKMGMDGLIVRFFKDLGYDIDAELYTEYQGTITDDGNKADVVATNSMIINIDDIDNMLINQKSEGALRSKVSQNKITMRPLYTNTLISLPRTGVYVGTSNNPNILRDRTENRWMVFEMEKAMDFDFFGGLDVMQLWAQIYQTVKKGDPNVYNFSQADLKAIQDSTSEFLYRTPIETYIEENWVYDEKSTYTYDDVVASIPGIFEKEARSNDLVRSFKLMLKDGQEHSRKVRTRVKGKKKQFTYWNFSKILGDSNTSSVVDQVDLPF